MNLESWRELFPITQGLAYLNNAAESPLNTLVEEKLKAYLALSSRAPHAKPAVRQEVRTLLASLLGGKAEDYALVSSTGIGLNIAANGYPWSPGDNVVVPMDEHWNNTFPWFSLKERGVEVRLVPVDEQNRLDLDKLSSLVDDKTRIVACAAVRHTTGYRADLKIIGQIAHNQGALFVVDGIQAAGVIPLDVMREDIDVLASAAFKWLLGFPGSGMLYVNEKARELICPTLPGMFAAEDNLRELRYFDDSRRYETGTIAYPFYHAWTAGLELLLKIGVDLIYERVIKLTDQLIEGLQKHGAQIISPVRDVKDRSAILSFTLGSKDKNQALFEKLQAQNISISIRDGRCRISPSFFNSEEEIDAFLAALS
jgi:cysteine desulfurase/selenocysteine lyase